MNNKWIEYELGDLIHIKHGYAFKGIYFSVAPTKDILLTPGNFKIGGGFKGDKLKYYKGPIPKDYILKENDIIVTMTDLSKEGDTLGYSAKIPGNSDKIFLHNQRIGLVTIISEDVEKEFLYWLLRLSAYQRFIANSATGATVKHTSPSKIYNFNFKAPLPKTQQKIAAILTAYDDLIENNNKRISILENMAEQIYKEWFVRMRFPNYKNTKFVKGIPQGWEIAPISSIYLTSSGGTPSRGINKYYEGNIPWIKTGELRDTFIMSTSENITQEGLNNSSAKLFPKYSVILALYGATIGQVGITTQESATNQACCMLLPKSDYISYEFTFHLIRTLKQYFFLVAFGGAQQNISQDIVKKTKTTIPPKQLIVDYINKVKNFYLQIENLQKQQILLKESRDLLLPRLLSGKLSVENLDIKFPPSMENDNA